MPTVADLIAELEVIAPPELAEENDRIGLQVGNRSKEVRKVCVSVDTSPPLIDRAIEAGADLLVSHHPLIYTPLTSIAEGEPVSDRLSKLIRSDTALFVMHTNYDLVPGGINDILAQRLGLSSSMPLMSSKQDRLYKIVVFVPEEAVENLRNMMADAGAGMIGQYTHCSFRTKGIGSFVPLPAARPYIGSEGKLEQVEEWRLEMVCTDVWLDGVTRTMLEHHPYDEVAYDIYELENDAMIYGLGRVGMLEKDVKLGDFADMVINELEVEYPKLSGDPEQMVRRVAVCGGSGSGLFREAYRLGAQVYVTGDSKHHDMLDAAAVGLAMIDAGHFETERPGVVALAERLAKSLSALEVEYLE